MTRTIRQLQRTMKSTYKKQNAAGGDEMYSAKKRHEDFIKEIQAPLNPPEPEYDFDDDDFELPDEILNDDNDNDNNYDDEFIKRELEKKFEELFGNIDDNDDDD